MKTKHHLIVALTGAGLPENRAIFLAGKAFAKDKDGKDVRNARAYLDAVRVEAHNAMLNATLEANALQIVLQKWPNEPVVHPAEDVRRTRIPESES